VVVMVAQFSIPNVAHAADGVADPTFGNGGLVMTDFSGNFDWINDVLVQPDGKILAVGATDMASGLTRFALARYNPDGSLDQSFGVGGRVVASDERLEIATSAAI